MQALGKHIDPFVYVHESAYHVMPATWQAQVDAARRIAKEAGWEGHSNVFKLNKAGNEISLLHYPAFFDLPFPELACSVHVDISARLVSVRDYGSQENPPILHRKELLLSPADPRRYDLLALSQQAEAAGLFDSPKTIGNRQQWLATIAAKGYSFTDGALLPLGNELNEGNEEFGNDTVHDPHFIARHLTALKRTSLSAPIQALLRRGFLKQGDSFFDYGCGRGDDVVALRDIGVLATGWDPYFARDEEKRRAAVVNLGFVINVIEDRDERDAAVREAFSLAEQVLSVAAMLAHRAPIGGRPYADGLLTSRRTFQRYFSQSQLRDYIEEVLGEEPVAIAPGIFFVFKNKELEHQLLRVRYSTPILVRGRREVETKPPKPPRAIETMRVADRTPQRTAVPRPRKLAPEIEFQQELSELWSVAVSLGRFPEQDEVDRSLFDRLAEKSITLRRCESLVYRIFDQAELDRSRNRRRDDLLVLLAVQQLARKRKRLEPQLQRDVRAFFGSSLEASAESAQLVQGLRNPKLIEQLCVISGELGLGWLHEDGQLQFASSILPRLHPLLRLYVAAATILLGSLEQFDVIKIHSRSGKVTLLRFDNFVDAAVPELLFRVKVNLRTQDAEEFVYGQDFPAPLLHQKSRYMDKDAPGYGQQLRFEARLAELGLFDFTGYGPSAADFKQTLRMHRWEIVEGDLARAQQAPALDDPCGRYLKFRDLIHCGETFAGTGTPNLPRAGETYNALYELATRILDTVIEYFGSIRLTYGFCSPELSKLIPGRIAPKLDQHCSHELARNGKAICERGGAACDFIVEDEDMFEVAQWVFENTPVDRIYVYGRDRPIHVSYSSKPSQVAFQMITSGAGRILPRQISKAETKQLAFVDGAH